MNERPDFATRGSPRRATSILTRGAGARLFLASAALTVLWAAVAWALRN